MNAQQRFVVLCAALFDDAWVERIEDAIDAMPEEFQGSDDPHYQDTLDYADDRLDREYHARGQW